MKTCMMICAHARPTTARSCRLSERRVARRTPCGQRLARQCVSEASVRRRPGKTKQGKEKARPEQPRVHLNLFFDCLDKVGKPTERNRPEARGRFAGQLGKTRTIWHNGEKETPRQRVRPECSATRPQSIL